MREADIAAWQYNKLLEVAVIHVVHGLTRP
jgi:hypothetical protein